MMVYRVYKQHDLLFREAGQQFVKRQDVSLKLSDQILGIEKGLIVIIFHVNQDRNAVPRSTAENLPVVLINRLQKECFARFYCSLDAARTGMPGSGDP